MVSPNLNQRRDVVGAGEEFDLFQVIVAFYRGKSSYKLPFGKNIFKDSPSPPSKSKIMHCCPFGISDSLTQSGVMESMNHLWSLWLSVSLMDVRGPCRCEGILLTKKGSRNSELAFKLGTLNMTTFVSFLYVLQCARFVSEKTCQFVPWQENHEHQNDQNTIKKIAFGNTIFEVANQPLLFWGSLRQKMQKKISLPLPPQTKGVWRRTNSPTQSVNILTSSHWHFWMALLASLDINEHPLTMGSITVITCKCGNIHIIYVL